MSSLGGLKRKKHATSIFNEYDVSLTCLYFSNPKLLKNEIGEYVLLACPESWGGIKMGLVLFCFSVISLGNFGFFLLFCVLRVHILQNLWSGCNLLPFLNQRKTGFYMHKYSQEQLESPEYHETCCQITRVAVCSPSHSYHLSFEPA